MAKRTHYSCDELLHILHSHSDIKGAPKKDRFKIYSEGERPIGLSTGAVRKIARGAVPDLKVAKCLWDSHIYEARLLAVLVTPRDEAAPALVHKWLSETRSWAVCDMIAGELIAPSEKLMAEIGAWAGSQKEFVRRGALSAIACHAVRVKSLSSSEFERFGDIIWRGSDDERLYVKKSASWALRQLGKIDSDNKARAVSLAKRMAHDTSGDPPKVRQWAGKDALKELNTLIQVPERRRLLSSSSAMGRRYLAAHPEAAL